MKITGINIGEYRQFKNINFDFTYPADYHDETKRGKPLEKVCFIGQSGTGKTTLLRLLRAYFSDVADACKRITGQRQLDLALVFTDFKADVQIKSQVAGVQFEISRSENPGFYLANRIIDSGLGSYFKNQILFCLYIGDSIAAESDRINRRRMPVRNRDSIIGHLQEIFDEKEGPTLLKVHSQTVGLRSGIGQKAWEYLLNDISEYDDNIIKIAQSILSELGTLSPTILFSRLESWKGSNPDPRLNLAERCLNPILSKFHLEVDTETSGGVIQIRTKSSTKIKTSDLSTGTLQILATAIPIYKFDTTDTVILFDEPERSLFPDIQRDLVQYYTGLAPTAQFFFATHSPIIAAAFDPCERFILDFNEDGEVVCRKGVAPIGDDPNDILSADFGMNELMNDDGLAAYKEYRNLGMCIRNETNEEEKNKLIIKRLELGNLYNF